jgi:hypothetical protein
LRAGSSICVAVRNCSFGCAGTGCTTEDTAGSSSESTAIDSCDFRSATNSLSSVGLVHGGSGNLANNNFEALGTAAFLYGNGKSIDGGRCERCNDGYVYGVDSGGTNRGLHGFCHSGEEMEGVVTFVDFRGAVTGFSVGPIAMTGHDASNAGLSGHNANSNYGIRVRADTAHAGEFVAASANSWFDTGGIYIEDYTTSKRGYLTFVNCNPSIGGGTGAAWRNPSASVWPKFIECSGIDASTGPTTGTRYLFANLPSGSDLLEGDEFDISNGSTPTIGSAVTGTGANRVHIRWDGTSWICTGG